MDEVKWDSLVIEVTDYLNADESLDGALKQVVELHLQVGQDNPNEREAAANALKALLKGRDGSPLGRRGQRSSVPAAIRVAMFSLCVMIVNGACCITCMLVIMNPIIMEMIK